jgi:hypothetical protein
VKLIDEIALKQKNLTEKSLKIHEMEKTRQKIKNFFVKNKAIGPK